MTAEDPSRAAFVRPGLLLALALVLIAACHAPALGGSFVWDDRFLILDAPLVVELRPLHEYFQNPFWSGGGAGSPSEAYFRPLVTLSFAIDHALFSGNATGFHLTNLLLHLLNVLLVYRFVRSRTSAAITAVVLALGWGLHPRLTEAVSWISGRTDVLATTFVLSSLLLFHPTSLGRRLAAALVLLPALFAKEVGLAGVLALGALEWQQGNAARAKLSRLAPVAVVFATYLGTRALLFGFPFSSLELGPAARALSACEAVGRYLFLLANPWQPSALSGALSAHDYRFVIPGAAALLLALVVAVRHRARLRAADWPALALVTAGLGLVLHVVPIPTATVAADRFLYLPLIGLAALAAPRLERWLARSAAVRLAALGVIASFGAVTASRASLWADELRFWMAEHARAPAALTTTWVELGTAFARVGLHREAFVLADRGSRGPLGQLRLVPYYNSALALSRLGRTAEARERFAECLRLRPADVRCRRSLALLDLQEMRFAEARSALSRLDAHGLLLPEQRLLLADLDTMERAARALQKPSFAASPAGAFAEAELKLRLGRLWEVVPLWQRVLETNEQERALLALQQLVALGDPATMELALRRYAERFGAPSEVLLNAYALRRAQLEDALRAKRELGL